MNSPLISTTNLQRRLKRRKTMAVAAAVVAGGVAGGIAGCNLVSPASKAPVASRSGTTADDMVNNYTSDIEKALDNVDRRRLDAAKQAGQASAKGDGAKPDATKSVSAPLEPVAVDPVTASDRPKIPLMLVSAGAHATDAHTAEAAHAPAENPSEAVHALPAHGAEEVHPPTANAESTKPPLLPEGRLHTVETPEPSSASEATSKAPLPSASPMSGVVIASPADAVSAAIANPLSAPVAPAASAMGAMTSMTTTPHAGAESTAAEHASAAEPSLDDALAVLRKSIGAHPTLNTALALALLDGEKTPDGDIAKSLSDSDQKVLTDLVSALDLMKLTPTASVAALSQRAAPIVNAVKKWQADADLSLPCLSLASRVDSYGVYTPVTPTFEQGRRHTIIIYCEVANFGSKKGDDGWYTTHLTQQESLITEDKLLVWRPNAEDVEDRSLNQRHDFYLVKKLILPETLAAGKYTLRMDVSDTNTGKRAIQSLEIQLITK